MRSLRTMIAELAANDAESAVYERELARTRAEDRAHALEALARDLLVAWNLGDPLDGVIEEIRQVIVTGRRS